MFNFEKLINPYMLELLLWLLAGILVGTLCGLVPGIHPNVFVAAALGAAITSAFNPLSIAVFLIAAGVANSFVSFIPAILLGAPEDDSALSVLPGHRLLMAGRGYEAIKLTVVGSLGAVLFTLITLPLFALFVPPLYHIIRPSVHWLLAAVVAYMVLTERGLKAKVFALVTFILAGALGVITLDVWSNDILFPLLSGLFGLPLLLLSFKRKITLPESFGFEEERLSSRTTLSGIGIGSLAGILAGLLPGIGSAQATVLAQQATGREAESIDARKFLIAIGGVTTADIVYSLLALWLIGNPRSGIAVGVGRLLEINLSHIPIFLAVILTAAGAAAYLTLKLSRKALFAMRRIDYPRLSVTVFALICALIAIFSGFYGMLVAGIALAIGLIPNLTNIRRSHAMGCLILPTILYFI